MYLKRTKKPQFADVLLQMLQYSRASTCAGVSFSPIKKRPQYRCFPVNIAKFLRTSFLIEHLRWLLLKDSIMDYLLESFQIVENCISNQNLNISIKKGNEACISVLWFLLNVQYIMLNKFNKDSLRQPDLKILLSVALSMDGTSLVLAPEVLALKVYYNNNKTQP